MLLADSAEREAYQRQKLGNRGYLPSQGLSRLTFADVPLRQRSLKTGPLVVPVLTFACPCGNLQSKCQNHKEH
jgi:hypothetical protein